MSLFMLILVYGNKSKNAQITTNCRILSAKLCQKNDINKLFQPTEYSSGIQYKKLKEIL
jgi:hypothetical protein